MKHLNIVTKDMNINASDEEELKQAHFFLITDNEASEHSDERPEDESLIFSKYYCQ